MKNKTHSLLAYVLLGIKNLGEWVRMPVRIFFSFHYERDIARANVVRNHYLTKGGYQEAGYWDNSLWEETKTRGDRAIRELIDDGLEGTTVTVVLIGKQTASRKWVCYEIGKSRDRGNRVIGVYIHGIKDFQGQTDQRGANPFGFFYSYFDLLAWIIHRNR